MKFLIPVTIDSLNREDLSGRTIIPLYINPETFSIQEAKIINKSQTKGGFVIQYWGEDLPKIQASGTTGSGGIEAINILRAVYRHEQIQFNTLLLDRARILDQAARETINNSSAATVGAGVTSLLDEITQGGFSGIVDGISSIVDEVTDAAIGINEPLPSKVELIPSIAAFATSIDLFWSGETFRGYFEDFKVDESAARPGHFEYSFAFTVTKRRGTRKNFMPWHRNPYDQAGEPRPASLPEEGAAIEELSIPSTQTSVTGVSRPLSKFTQTQEGEAIINNVGINRLSKIRSGS